MAILVECLLQAMVSKGIIASVVILVMMEVQPVVRYGRFGQGMV